MSVIGFYLDVVRALDEIDESIDLDYITPQAVALGASAADLWTQLRERAVADTQAHLGHTGKSEGKNHA